MGRAKIPRKSTNIDMTAMCDVAFLLLSFFIMATKQKPPEAVAVNPPTSVASKVAPDDAILITLTKEGKVFLMLGDNTKKLEILKDINTTRGLGLSDGELAILKKMDFIGLPLNLIKSSLGKEIPSDQLPGIPCKDSANNELVDWMRSVMNVYRGGDMRALQEKILIKGDGDALYPQFKQIKYAFKKNEIFKFRLVTNGEPPPYGSELYYESKKPKPSGGN